VCWTGYDLGAGIASYDIYVSINQGPWSLWLAATTNICATFNGQAGSAYGFLSLGHDAVGNIEPSKTIADATTTVSLQSRPAFQNVSHTGSLVSFSWSSISGRTYQLQYSRDLSSAGWTNLGGSITATNTSVSASDPIISDRHRFYRVMLLP
jgi:hypothetical protein